MLAFDAQDAADCAAFSMANWDFEEERFSKEDRSPEWKSQAGGFVLVSERLGFSRAQAMSTIRNKRGPYKNTLTKYLSGEGAAEAQFDEITGICDKILNRAPEMKPFR